MKDSYPALMFCIFSLLTIDCVALRKLPEQIRPLPAATIERPGQNNKAANCCHKKLTIADSDYEEAAEEQNYYLPARQKNSAYLIVTSDSGQLLACRYQAIVSISDNVVTKKYLCRPRSPQAIDLRTLKVIGRVSVKIHSNSPVTFEDFVEEMLHHPPDQAQFVRYLHSEEVWENTGANASPSLSPQFYCQHYFVLYKSKILQSSEELRRWVQK